MSHQSRFTEHNEIIPIAINSTHILEDWLDLPPPSTLKIQVSPPFLNPHTVVVLNPIQFLNLPPPPWY
ncbi:unnamed protein product [Adineta ricciae]|uniref:Uncharacterized protein n=1 Tax=Adineta ricciae TaxID=249248 RepID=A0A815TAN9_ADIRI|nr:unnamed protein product [Adineta ricciae]CAF1498572.1 unnamed protein product [Adineta ricciae]